jgi:hypothetical protein
MDQPQVLGTIPWSTRGSTKEGGRNRTKKQSCQLWRTVRPGGADCPQRPCGLSGRVSRTVRTLAADCPKRQQNLQRRTAYNGPSAGSTRTVRQAPVDCPPGTHGPSETLPNENSKPWRVEDKGEQEDEELAKNTHVADCPRLADRAETCSTSKVNPSNPSPDLPNGRSCWDKSLGTWYASTKDAIPQKFRLLTP